MSDTRLNEGFVKNTDHLRATDPAPFGEAAAVLEAGGTIEDAFSLLGEQHRTTLFHIEKRPPLPMLASKSKADAAKILRKCADKLEGSEDER